MDGQIITVLFLVQTIQQVKVPLADTIIVQEQVLQGILKMELVLQEIMHQQPGLLCKEQITWVLVWRESQLHFQEQVYSEQTQEQVRVLKGKLTEAVARGS